ncbi:MAG: hypothetical protein AB7T38_14945 [Nitrospirales bacterium]
MCIDEEFEKIIRTEVDTFKCLANYLKAYSLLQEKHLEQLKSELWDPYSQNVPMPEELDLSRYLEIEVFYPMTLRESLFMASFSHFESIVNEICEKIGDARKFSVGLYDLKDRGVRRAYNYLTKVVGLSVSSASWSSVKFLNELRNLIVHNNSKVEAKNNKHQGLRNTAEKWPTIDVPEDGRMKFHSEFNGNALDVFLDFFDQLEKNNVRSLQ